MTILSHSRTDQKPTPHPRWCAPRLCASDIAGVEHRSESAAWTATCDYQVTVGTVRYDEALADGEVLRGDDRVRITAEDQACVNPGGGVIAVELDLTAGEARRFAAQLQHFAAQIESLAGAR